MNHIEITAVLFSLLSVILTVNQNRWCWPVGIIGILFYSIIFLQQGLMGNFWLQFLFLGQSLLGMWNWNKLQEKMFVTWFEDRTFLYSLTFLVYMITLLILESQGSKMPYLDATTTVLSIFAMFLLAFKVIDGWYYWIIADLAYILIFMQSNLYLSAGIYFIFLWLSIMGLIRWVKNSDQTIG